jgi:bifunctional non-homologous end joining protein LigD
VPQSQRLAFIRPLSPSAAVRPPQGDDWLHEPKWGGFRFQIIKDGSAVRFYSRHGAEYTYRLPGMVEAFAKLPTQSAISRRRAGPDRSPRRSAFPSVDVPNADESQLMFLAFDLLHQDGVDLRGVPLTERKRDLHRLCVKSRVPFMRELQTFPNGPLREYPNT